MIQSRTRFIYASLAIVAMAIAAGSLVRRESGEASPEQQPEQQRQAQPVAPAADRVAKVIPFQAPPTRALPIGEFRVADHGGRFTVEANQAPRLELLEELAERADFAVLDHVRKHPLVSLDVRDESIEHVLARVIRGVPYAILYAGVGASSGPPIDILELGIARSAKDTDEPEQAERDSGEVAARALKASDAAKRGEREAKYVEARPEHERRAALERREVRERERRERYLEQLEHSDPELRAWAASELDTDQPEDVARLNKLLSDDLDASVRAEVAHNLGFSDPYTAVPILLSALNDPSPDVVAAAANALGYLDDASASPKLRELLNRDSEIVREAARHALELLEGAD